MMFNRSRWLPARWYGHNSSSDGGAAGVAVIGAIIIVLLVLVIWAIVKAVDLVIRAWRQSRGKSRELRIALLIWVALFVLMALTIILIANRVVPLDTGKVAASVIQILLDIATVALLITARATELKYRQTFMREPEALVTKVLHRPWWTSGRQQAA